MADIAIEVESLRDFVADPTLYSRVWMQTMPAKYTAGELSIRYQGGNTASETGYHYRLDREYQLVYFGTSERDCIIKGSALERKFNSKHVIQLKGSERNIRVGPFSMSQPFKTEGGEVFAIIGMLQAELREARDFTAEEAPKMGEVVVAITPSAPVNPSEDSAPLKPSPPPHVCGESCGGAELPELETGTTTEIKTKCGGGI